MNPQNAQMPSWMFRLVVRRPAAPASSLMASRIQVCPPELWPSSLSWRGRFTRWTQRLANQVAPWLPEPARPVNRLAVVKNDFNDTLSDLNPDEVHRLLDQIDRARSLREMWHLRSSVFGEVAMALSQSEAERRLARLNRHFPVRAQRLALAPAER